jgi:predicted  nucleic acid-binding Zn-ribbon protein
LAKKKKKIHKKSKKRVSKKLRKRSGEVLISNVFKNLGKEVNKLEKEKHSLEGKLDGVQDKITAVQERQMELRNQISKLIETEAKLNSERMRAERQLSEVKGKLGKTVTVHKDLKGIWG